MTKINVSKALAPFKLENQKEFDFGTFSVTLILEECDAGGQSLPDEILAHFEQREPWMEVYLKAYIISILRWVSRSSRRLDAIRFRLP